MFINVVLPAPFSPSSACTSPALITRLTSLFAETPGNLLVIPFISTRGEGSLKIGSVPPASSAEGHESKEKREEAGTLSPATRLRCARRVLRVREWYLDCAVGDPGSCLVEKRLDRCRDDAVVGVEWREGAEVHVYDLTSDLAPRPSLNVLDHHLQECSGVEQDARHHVAGS